MPYILIILLLIVCAVLSWLLIKARRNDSLQTAAEKSRHHVVDGAVDVLKKLLNANKNDNIDEQHWYRNLCMFFQDNYHADGCCIIRAVTKDKNNREYELLTTSGCCEEWQDKKQGQNLTFNSHVSKHFYWSTDAHLLTDNVGECLPDEASGQFSTVIAGVFKIHKHQAFLLLLNKNDQTPFTMDDLNDFEASFHIARAGIEIISYAKDNKQLADNIDKAHQEGMVQISSGIIHNIGNGMAVLKMALENLDEFKSIIQLSQFLQDEIIPALEKDIVTLKPDSTSSIEQYVGAIKEIMEKISNIAGTHDVDLQKLHDKFQNVIEIISLQQQFIGELGTENIVSISTVLNDVVKMIEQPMEQNKIELKLDIKTTAEALVDPALFRQVLLVICKYSIDSINTSRHASSLLEISASDSEETETNEKDEKITKKLIAIEVSNNGYGIDFDPEAEFSTQSKEAQQYRELLFCKNKVEKYDGSFIIESSEGLGANVLINIPVYKK